MRHLWLLLLFASPAFALQPLLSGHLGGIAQSLKTFQAPVAVDIDFDGKDEALLWNNQEEVWLLDGLEAKLWYTTSDQVRGIAPLGAEVIIAEAGKLHVFDKWKNEYLGWPKAGNFAGPPITADLENDGQLEILIPTADGLEVRHLYGPVQTIPGRKVSVGDINGDGRPEIATTSEGGVYLFDSELNPVSGWPKTPGSELSKPVISAGKLAVTTAQGKLFVWDATGKELFKQSTGQSSSYEDIPAPLLLGDLIITAGPGNEVHVFKNSQEAEGWPVRLENTTNIRSDPIAVDLLGDSNPEIIVPAGFQLYALDLDGSIAATYQMDGLVKTPALLDLDGNGTLELVAVSESEPGVAGKPLLVLQSQVNATDAGTLDNIAIAVPEQNATTSLEPEPNQGQLLWQYMATLLRGMPNHFVQTFHSHVFPDRVAPVVASGPKRYLILSEKSPLVENYGAGGAITLMNTIDSFGESVRMRGMAPVVIYLDDKQSTGRFNLTPVSQGENPLSLVKSLVKAVQPSFILILGGHQTVPLQKRYYPALTSIRALPFNRSLSISALITDIDLIAEVYTDDYYADTDGDAYQLPDIPIGRLPESGRGPASAEYTFFRQRIRAAARPAGNTSRESFFYQDRRWLVDPQRNPLGIGLGPNYFKNYTNVTTHEVPPYRLGIVGIKVKGDVVTILNVTTEPASADLMASEYGKGGIQFYLGHGPESGLQTVISQSWALEFRDYYELLLDGEFIVDRHRYLSPQVLVSLACFGANIFGREAGDSLPILYAAHGGKAYIGTTTVCNPAICTKFAQHLYDAFESEETVGEAFITAKHNLVRMPYGTYTDAIISFLAGGAYENRARFMTPAFMLYGDPAGETFE